MNGKKLTARFEPAQHRLHVIIAPLGIDSAKEGVLEEPAESFRRWVLEKVGDLKLRRQSCSGCLLFCQANRRRGQIEPKTFKACLGPGARIMPGAAAGHAHLSAWQGRMGL